MSSAALEKLRSHWPVREQRARLDREATVQHDGQSVQERVNHRRRRCGVTRSAQARSRRAQCRRCTAAPAPAQSARPTADVVERVKPRAQLDAVAELLHPRRDRVREAAGQPGVDGIAGSTRRRDRMRTRAAELERDFVAAGSGAKPRRNGGWWPSAATHSACSSVQLSCTCCTCATTPAGCLRWRTVHQKSSVQIPGGLHEQIRSLHLAEHATGNATTLASGWRRVQRRAAGVASSVR